MAKKQFKAESKRLLDLMINSIYTNKEIFLINVKLKDGDYGNLITGETITVQNGILKGRRKPVGTGKFATIKVDSVIGAIGQRVDWGSLDIGKLIITNKGTAEADSLTYQTAEPDIFVGGDDYTGPSFAINAIAAGKEAAISLHRFVHHGQTLTMGRCFSQQ